jgi:hypothetical protein
MSGGNRDARGRGIWHARQGCLGRHGDDAAVERPRQFDQRSPRCSCPYQIPVLMVLIGMRGMRTSGTPRRLVPMGPGLVAAICDAMRFPTSSPESADRRPDVWRLLAGPHSPRAGPVRACYGASRCLRRQSRIRA